MSRFTKFLVILSGIAIDGVILTSDLFTSLDGFRKNIVFGFAVLVLFLTTYVVCKGGISDEKGV